MSGLMAGIHEQDHASSHVGAGTSSGRDSPTSGSGSPATPSRYEAQKRRDWNTFGQYLKNHRPPLALSRCSGANVLEFLRYLDQFGKTKIHAPACPFFGIAHPPAPCACPLRQAWGSLDALIGRLRAAFEEHGGKPESNPFGARAVRLYLREVREMQAKARGIAYEKKKRKRPNATGSSSNSSNNSSGTGSHLTAVSQQQQQQHQQQQEHHHHHHHQAQIVQLQQVSPANHVLQQAVSSSIPLIQHQLQHQQFLPQGLQPGLQILN